MTDIYAAARAHLDRIRQAGGSEPMTVEEELQAARLALKGDVAAFEELVRRNQRLVVNIVLAYRKTGLDVEDLIQAANEGLMIGIRKFDPDRGYRLSTYVAPWMRAYIMQLVRGNSHVKITQKPFLLLGQVRREHRRRRVIGADVSADAIADAVGKRVGDVTALLAYTQPSIPLDAPDAHLIVNTLASLDESADETIATRTLCALLLELLKELDARQLEIVKRRRLVDEPETLADIGASMGISRERVRQLEEKALQNLRERLFELLGDI